MLGGLITTGTNPLSGRFSYRQYVYDKYVMSTPPPHFPVTPLPTFRNWHEVDVASVGDYTDLYGDGADGDYFRMLGKDVWELVY